MDELDAVMAERRRLIALAYRLLGTLEEAEDAVQETYLRWYRLTGEEREAIGNPQGWLTRVASRICLDVLKSARARREQYVGDWLPEPVPAGLLGDSAVPDPADRVTLDDTVSTALLVLLDTMTPAERVAFVLHDVFALPFPEVAEIVGRSPAAVRQLATAARRRIADHRGIVDPPAEHDAVVRAFLAAAGGGNLGALTSLLDPSVTLRSDGGGVVRAARNPIVGPTRVARFLLGVLTKRSTWALSERVTADGLVHPDRRRRGARCRQPASRRRTGHRRVDGGQPRQADRLALDRESHPGSRTLPKVVHTYERVSLFRGCLADVV